MLFEHAPPAVVSDKASEKDEKTCLLCLQLREKLVEAVVGNAKVSEETSLSDVAQFASTLTAVTNKPEQNTEKMVVSTLFITQIWSYCGHL